MRKEGFHRLSILTGFISVIVMFFVLVGSSSGLAGAEWLGLIVVLTIIFFITMGIVRGIGWVIQGFEKK
jgi:hypothetical protein